MRRLTPLLIAMTLALVLGPASPCAGQLTPGEVLLVYDSRINDSLLVAEHYAGSANVPGGDGGRPGTRPGVLVVDLATLPGAVGFNASGQATLTQFRERLRDPLRTYLDQNALTGVVRCLVLTKGLPHRIRDTDNVNAGDSPPQSIAEFNAADATYSSVDSELTLLWQSNEVGEAGGSGDSRLDGVFVNPYWGESMPIGAWPTTNIQSPKSIGVASGTARGQFWISNPAAPIAAQLTPGDMYLVCRLDGNSVDDVRAMLDRGSSFFVDLTSVAFVLDESDSNGAAALSTAPDGELDNDPAPTNDEDDYEATRDLLLAHPTVPAAGIYYDALAGANRFLVGPLINLGGALVPDPVILLATYGENHNGLPGTPSTTSSTYAESFNYAPGATFNSIESFNARALGTLGTLQNQEQCADFIGAGGTFAIGSVYEPFTFGATDNRRFVERFYLGNLTFAEAAWASIPALSWSQVAIGDPLARPLESCPGDWNADGVQNDQDFFDWVNDFFSGAGPQGQSDFNEDGFENDQDFFDFVNAFFNPPPGC